MFYPERMQQKNEPLPQCGDANPEDHAGAYIDDGWDDDGHVVDDAALGEVQRAETPVKDGDG